MESPTLANPAIKLVQRFGGRRAVAEHFKLSPEAVRLWLSKGIPPERALDAEEATRGTEHAITAIEVLLFARQQRDGDSGTAVQLELPTASA